MPYVFVIKLNLHLHVLHLHVLPIYLKRLISTAGKKTIYNDPKINN